MKILVAIVAMLSLAGAALAEDCCQAKAKPQPKVAPQAKDCCQVKEAKPQPKAAPKAEKDCCQVGDSLTAACPDSRERAFWKEAEAMMVNDSVKHGEIKACCAAKGLPQPKPAAKECCESEADHKIMKGEDGCCNAPGLPAHFKVWASGTYHFFGCEGSAAHGRADLVKKGYVVGNVQPVVSKTQKV